MPNWCITEYKMSGLKEDIDSLQLLIEKNYPDSKIKNGFGKYWLGHLAQYFKMDYAKVHCRGSIIDFSRDNDTSYTILTETAWNQCGELMFHLAAKFDLNLLYLEDEPGLEIFVTNDVNYEVYEYDYNVDDLNKDLDDPFMDEEGVRNYLLKNYNILWDGVTLYYDCGEGVIIRKLEREERGC